MYVSTDCSLQELMCCPSVGPSNTACCRLRLPLLQSPVFAAAPSKCICREISRLDLCRRPPGRPGRAGPSSAGRGVRAPQYSQCCEYPSTSSSLGPHSTAHPGWCRCPPQCPVFSVTTSSPSPHSARPTASVDKQMQGIHTRFIITDRPCYYLIKANCMFVAII